MCTTKIMFRMEYCVIAAKAFWGEAELDIKKIKRRYRKKFEITLSAGSGVATIHEHRIQSRENRR